MFSKGRRAFGTESRSESRVGLGISLPSGLGQSDNGLSSSLPNPASGLSGPNLESSSLNQPLGNGGK